MSRGVFPRIFIGAFLVLAGWVGYQAYQESRRTAAIQDEIGKLEAEKAKIVQENAFLQNRVEYLRTDDFQKQEAKEKLNYREDGEKVVIIKPMADVLGEDTENAAATSGEVRPTVYFQSPNYRKWWNEFFGASGE